MLTWLVATAIAAPNHVLVPVAVGHSVADEYRAFLAKKKLPEASLVCQEVWQGRTQVCFQVEVKGKRRFVSSADLKSWNMSKSEVWAVVARSATSKIVEGLQLHRINGDESRQYWSWVDGTNWPSGGLVVPHEILRVTNLSSVMVALPTKDTLLVWPAGDETLNQMMAVGSVEISDANDGLDPSAFRMATEGWQEGLLARPLSASGSR